MNNRINPKLYEVLKVHYENGDYTESVRDAFFYVTNLIQELSGLMDIDGTSLIDKSFGGNNPSICVSKNDTKTQKDIQQGMQFALKGLYLSVRNPISHEKIVLTQNEADAIIVYLDYLLAKIGTQNTNNTIDKVFELLADERCPNTKMYAEALFKTVPSKKRYDLLVELYNRKTELSGDKCKHIIELLFENLSKTAIKDFVSRVDSEMIKCRDDKNLRMYIEYYMEHTYNELSELSRLRMEDMIKASIYDGAILDETMKCNKEGSLATWVSHVNIFRMLSNKKELIENMLCKLLYIGGSYVKK